MKSLLTPLILSVFACTSSQAATLATFQFTGNSLASADTSTTWETSDLASGGGVPTDTFDASLGSPAAPSLSFVMGNVNDGTFLDEDYYTFSITPDAGNQIEYTSLTFDFQKVSGGANVDWRVYSSVDSFSSILGSGSISATGSWTTGHSADLSGLGTQTAATEFRVYFFTTGTFGPNGLLLDNLVVDGSATAIPEASSLLLGALGTLLLLRRQRA